MSNFNWLNSKNRLFLSRGYVESGTAEDRYYKVAATAAKIYPHIPGFENKLRFFFEQGYISLASPIISNFGNDRGLPISCNNSHMDDSVESIVTKVAEIETMTKHGAGTSLFMGDLRPRGSKISGGGVSYGPVHFAELIQTGVNIISQTNVRRGHCAIWLPVEHPDIMEWLEMREEGHVIQHLSFGVTVTRQWIHEMKNGDEKKQEIWWRIIRSRYEKGYPYIFFHDNVNDALPQWYKDAGSVVRSSNMCFTGDTLVAVADGRNAVRIDELCDSGDFFVYSSRRKLSRHKGWKIQAKKAKAFKTGTREIVRIVLNDGSSFRCTPDHLLALPSGDYVEAKDSVGLELASIFTRKMNNYRLINSLSNGYSYQHRYIWEAHNGPKPEGVHIDHIISGNGDQIENLQILDREDHFKKTSSEVEGENNSVHKIRDIEKWKHRQSVKSSRYSNGNWSGLTDEDMISIGIEVLNTTGNLKIKDLLQYSPKFPKSLSKNRFGGSWKTFRSIVEGKIEYVEPVEKVDLYEEGGLETPGNLIVTEVVYTGEVEDVYDLTVEDNHNFYILTSGDEDFKQSRGVLVHNCTEITEPSTSDESFVCDLLSLNLEKWDEWKNTDLVRVSIYLLDAVMEEYIRKTANIKYLEAAHQFAKRHRSLGLGVLGWHTLLQKEQVAFGSKRSFELNEEIWKHIRSESLTASMDLAKLYGEPSVTYGYGVRNSMLNAVAPTKSSSYILGAGQLSASTDPWESNYYVENLAKTKETIRNKYLEKYLEDNRMNTPETWTKILLAGGSVKYLDIDNEAREVFKTYDEIDMKDLILLNAQRAKFIDQSQSMNLKYRNDVDQTVMSRDLLLAEALGVKTIYYQIGINATQDFARDTVAADSCVACEA